MSKEAFRNREKERAKTKMGYWIVFVIGMRNNKRRY
jgi:hypothetical protein